MDFLLSLLFAVICVVLLARMAHARDVLDFHLGVIGVFSLGYFCLPIWFKKLSPLNFFPSGEIALAVLIFLLFLVSVISGSVLGRDLVKRYRPVESRRIDGFLGRYRYILSAASFAFFLVYASTHALTSYSAVNFNAYFERGGVFSGLESTLADLALGYLAVTMAIAFQHRRRLEVLAHVAMLSVCLGVLLLVGQRLAFLTPIVMVMAALAATGQRKKAVAFVFLGVVALGVISPIAVSVRQAPETQTAGQAVSNFSFGQSPGDTILQSIVDRGDLLLVTVGIKSDLDEMPRPGWVYYESVLVNPVPNTFFPSGKPYLLSSNGEPGGELSVFAWNRLHGGGIGSLTAFGGLVAYRELGWPGVILNGFATGMLFAVVGRRVGDGGYLAKIFYVVVFVSLSVKKVPPSFWEALSSLVPMIPFVLLAMSVEYFGRSSNVRSYGTRPGVGAMKGSNPREPLGFRD